ncbi:MAG: hypothetical protein Dasosvirus4_38 [Dasosvirus sp.]|uniref:Ankyrin repeat protein n=1 Tax=Dasosvirus sp. TaxID=2487764 RepID=A0A3G4ZRJ6_9VIRU|nr:MAG: hypothetical protein Dasosvirus4_38 [Dasosvirus sp.]
MSFFSFNKDAKACRGNQTEHILSFFERITKKFRDFPDFELLTSSTKDIKEGTIEFRELKKIYTNMHNFDDKMLEKMCNSKNNNAVKLLKKYPNMIFSQYCENYDRKYYLHTSFLRRAMINDSLPIIKLLVNAGAYTGYIDSKRHTHHNSKCCRAILNLAISGDDIVSDNNNIETINFLIKNDPWTKNINPSDFELSPMPYTCRKLMTCDLSRKHRYLQIVQLLLDSKASFDIFNNIFDSKYMKNSPLEIFQFYVKYGNINKKVYISLAELDLYEIVELTKENGDTLQVTAINNNNISDICVSPLTLLMILDHTNYRRRFVKFSKNNYDIIAQILGFNNEDVSMDYQREIIKWLLESTNAEYIFECKYRDEKTKPELVKIMTLHKIYDDDEDIRKTAYLRKKRILSCNIKILVDIFGNDITEHIIIGYLLSENDNLVHYLQNYY